MKSIRAWLQDSCLRFSAESPSRHSLDVDETNGATEGSNVASLLSFFGLEGCTTPVYLVIGAGLKVQRVERDVDDFKWAYVTVAGNRLHFCRAGLKKLGIKKGTLVALVPRE